MTSVSGSAPTGDLGYHGKTMMGCREQSGSATILLVEDELLITDLTRRILERSGYSVLSAANGTDALSLYEKERQTISLVILDLILPGMGGIQCLEKLREVDPTVKILVTTGHPIIGAERQAIESGARGFLHKPFTMKQMLTAVRAVLDTE
ncbi:MAG: response regulator [Desulfomonilaceae bacterium]|nr:response regulator [Desulfomonilaceae bacterium]